MAYFGVDTDAQIGGIIHESGTNCGNQSLTQAKVFAPFDAAVKILTSLVRAL